MLVSHAQNRQIVHKTLNLLLAFVVPLESALCRKHWFCKQPL